jgi:GT2 family glycosyltransferase
LSDCIKSIKSASHCGFNLKKIVVVDNASDDDSLIHASQEYSENLRIIRNKKNKGFSAACNQGAEFSTEGYILFLNPDTRLFDNSLSDPVGFMEDSNNSSIGICGIRLVDEDGCYAASASRFPTLRVIAGKAMGLSRAFPNAFPSQIMSDSELSESRFVDQIIGAFFLIRSSVFFECGKFDERFFVYYEEVDLSLKAKSLGYGSFFISNVMAYHRGGGCSSQVKASRLFYSLRSRLLYAKKNYSKLEYCCTVFLTAVEFSLRIIQSLFKGSMTNFKNTVLGYLKLIYWWCFYY